MSETHNTNRICKIIAARIQELKAQYILDTDPIIRSKIQTEINEQKVLFEEAKAIWIEESIVNVNNIIHNIDGIIINHLFDVRSFMQKLSGNQQKYFRTITFNPMLKILGFCNNKQKERKNE